jgi:16S rRNA (uracil1498-N3)-methyltransferase
MRLEGELAHYLTRVLRLEPGATLEVFDPDTKLEGRASLSLGDGLVTLHVEALGPARVVARRELCLLQGLPKGDKLDAIVRDATELGASRVLLVAAARSVVKLDPKRAEERRGRLLRIAEEAARQSGRGDVPTIEGPFVPREAASRAPEGARFVLAPGTPHGLGDALLAALGHPDAPLTFAVGPEGGLAEDELRAFEDAGFVRVGLGPFVLRTETVAAAVLGAVRVLSS